MSETYTAAEDAAYIEALRVGVLKNPQACRYLQVAPRFFERGDGRVIPRARIGREIRFRLADLDAYLDSRIEQPESLNPRLAHLRKLVQR